MTQTGLNSCRDQAAGLLSCDGHIMDQKLGMSAA